MSQKPRVVGSQEVGSTRWLRLSTLTYTDRRGQPRAWDVATRTTTKEGAGADAVGILVVLKGETAADHQIVLVKQVHGQQGQSRGKGVGLLLWLIGQVRYTVKQASEMG